MAILPAERDRAALQHRRRRGEQRRRRADRELGGARRAVVDRLAASP